MEIRETAFDELYANPGVPDIGTPISSTQAMNLAFIMALQGAGSVKSNPLVGAVCVDKSQNFIAAAYHAEFGKAHAEQALIAQIYEQGLRERLEGATIYVTLEPCAHVGKTPACASVLSDLPIKKVVYGLPDPTPKTCGKGPFFLRQSGIQTELFSADTLMKSKLEFLTDSFISFAQHKRPFVAVKVASSLNGVFTYLGASRFWLTSERARAYGHWLRLLYDAIIVGAETVIQDNPSLDVRYLEKGRVPLRIVIDPQARALKARSFKDCNLLKSGASQTLWCLKESAWSALDTKSRGCLEGLGLMTLYLKESRKEDIFDEILSFLFDQGIASLLVEGGAGVWASAFNSNKVNKLYLFQAPKLFCQEQTMNWSCGLTRNCLDLQKTSLTRLKGDLLIEGYTTV